MTKKNLILLIILIVAAIGIVSFYVVYQPKTLVELLTNNNEQINKPEPIVTDEQILAQIKKDYPELLQGIITFQDTKTVLKTTIKLDGSGKEYTLYPAQPKSVYESMGVKSGGRVQMQARYFGTDKIEFGSMKPMGQI